MISVIIPVYNVEKYICRALSSLFQQTYRDFEIILVDDCGGDGSIACAKAYIEEMGWDGEVQFVHHDTNKGPSAARNSGIGVAKGEYVFFLDGDDTVSPRCFELLMQHAQQDDVDYVMAKSDCVFPQGRAKEDICFYNKTYSPGREDLIRLYRQGSLPWGVWNKLIKTSFIKENGLYFCNVVMAEDMLWNFVSLLYIQRVTLLDVHTYQYHRDREDSTTFSARTGTASYASDLLEVMEACESALHEGAPSRNLVKLYLELRYDYVPYSIYWHGYKDDVKRSILERVYNGRLRRFYRCLPLCKKLLFLLPCSCICQWVRLKYVCSELKYIVKNRLTRILK